MKDYQENKLFQAKFYIRAHKVRPDKTFQWTQWWEITTIKTQVVPNSRMNKEKLKWSLKTFKKVLI